MPDHQGKIEGPHPAVVRLGRMAFGQAHDLQLKVRDAVLARSLPETLLVLEHPSVITLGKKATRENITASGEELERSGVEIHRTERGGDVTFHGPGQLVCYPIFRIREGIRAFVRSLAFAVERTLARYEILCRWDETRPGLWVENRKIAAMGIHVHRGVSMHGLALNVSTDLKGFDLIIPCGLASALVTSMVKETGRMIDIDEVGSALVSDLMEACNRKPYTFFPACDLFSYLDQVHKPPSAL